MMSSAMPAGLSPGPDAFEQPGVRHAALLLHAMSPDDRAWMLDALPPPERKSLVPLLEELEMLGIARDPSLVQGIVPAASVGAATAARMPDEAVLHALDEAQVRELARCLRTEPWSLIAQLLSIADWPWRKDVLSALEPAQRRRVESALAVDHHDGAATPPALRAALIAGVVAELRGSNRSTAPVAPLGVLKRTFGRVFGHGLLPRSARL